MSGHPNDHTLELFVTARLDGTALLAVADHIESCADCKARAERSAFFAQIIRDGLEEIE